VILALGLSRCTIRSCPGSSRKSRRFHSVPIATAWPDELERVGALHDPAALALHRVAFCGCGGPLSIHRLAVVGLINPSRIAPTLPGSELRGQGFSDFGGDAPGFAAGVRDSRHDQPCSHRPRQTRWADPGGRLVLAPTMVSRPFFSL